MVRSSGTHPRTGTDPQRIAVTPKPDTCRLGLRLPAGVSFCSPHASLGSPARPLRRGRGEWGSGGDALPWRSALPRLSLCAGEQGTAGLSPAPGSRNSYPWPVLG